MTQGYTNLLCIINKEVEWSDVDTGHREAVDGRNQRNWTNWVVFLESGVDDTIGLHGWDSNVGDPQADKEAGSDGLDGFGTAQLAAHSGVTPEQEGQNGDQRLNAENGHRESQAVKSAPLSK